MSNINLKSSDYLGIARAIDSNKNNVIDNDEASLVFKSKKMSKSPLTVEKLAGSLQKDYVTLSNISKKSSINIAEYFSDRSNNTNKKIEDWNKKNIISKEQFSISNEILNFVDTDADEEISTNEFSELISSENTSIGKTINVKSDVIKKAPDKLERRFGTETAELINKFNKTPIGPYPKPYLCDVRNNIIENTSLIKDLECSNIFDKKPYQLAREVFDIPRVRDNPELKNKISNFANAISSNDKSALVSIQNILERNPKISDEDLKKIFDKLTTMLSTSYDTRVGNTKDFVVSSLHDISSPSNISQEEIGTCVGTTVQIQLAIRNPIEYLNMIDTLAKNQNYKTLTDHIVPPNFSFADEIVGTNKDTKRTISSKIMQNAIMDYGDAETRAFNSANDDGGLSYKQTVKVLNEIVNLNVENSHAWDYTPKQMMNIAKKSNPSRENPVEIALSYEIQGRDERHSVNLVELSNTQVTIINPWGREETFPTQELEKRILSVSNPVGLDKGISKIDTSESLIKLKINNTSTKDEMLDKISVEQKFEIIQKITSEWDYDSNSYKLKSNFSESDKKVVLNILDDMLKGGQIQNIDWYPRLKFIAPDKNELLQKLDLTNTDPIYINVKDKLLAEYLK